MHSCAAAKVNSSLASDWLVFVSFRDSIRVAPSFCFLAFLPLLQFLPLFLPFSSFFFLFFLFFIFLLHPIRTTSDGSCFGEGRSLTWPLAAPETCRQLRFCSQPPHFSCTTIGASAHQNLVLSGLASIRCLFGQWREWFLSTPIGAGKERASKAVAPSLPKESTWPLTLRPPTSLFVVICNHNVDLNPVYSMAAMLSFLFV